MDQRTEKDSLQAKWDKRFFRHDIMLVFNLLLITALAGAGVFVPSSANTLTVAIVSGSFATLVINLLIIVFGNYLDDKETRKSILELGKAMAEK